MNATIDIQCPKCSLLLRVAQPTVASELDCPKCGHRFGLTAQGKVTSAPRRDAFSDLPDPVMLDVVPARPKDFRPAKATPPPPEPPKPAGTFHAQVKPLAAPINPWKWVSRYIVPLICVLITIGGLSAVYSYRSELGLDDIEAFKTIAKSLPMVDSHEKVIDELVDASESATSVLADLRITEGSLDAEKFKNGIRSIDRLTAKIEQLRRRAASMDRMTGPQWDAMNADFEERTEARKGDLKTGLKSVPVQTPSRVADSADFQKAALGFVFALADTSSVIQVAWKPLDPPTTPVEQLEFDLMQADRGIWQAAMMADDEASYQAITQAYRTAAEQTEDAVQRAQEMSPPPQLYRPGSAYFSPALSQRVDTSVRIAKLSEQYGDFADSQATKAYDAACARLSEMQVTAKAND